MKRPEHWLPLVGGCAFGLVAGFLAAYVILDRGPAASANAGSVPAAPEAEGAPLNTSGGASGEKQFLAQDANRESPDPEALRAAVVDSLRMPRPLDQAGLLAVIQGLSKENFPAVLEILRNAKTAIHTSSLDSQGPLAWIVFWQRFGELDPEGALREALQSGDVQYRDRHLLEKHLFTGMARADPGRAAKLFLEHPELPNRLEGAEGLIHAWSAKDPNAALQWARENLEDAGLMRVTYALTWGAANAQSEYPDIKRAVSVAKSIPEAFLEPSLRALKDMVVRRAYVSAEDALAAVAYTREIGKRDSTFERAVIEKAMAVDSAFTSRYFTQLIESGASDSSEISSVAGAWAKRDFTAAEAWANQQSGTAYFPDVAKALSEAAARRNDHESARRWAEAMKASGAAPTPAN